MDIIVRKPLSPTQLAVFNCILTWFATFQRWPTVRELSLAQGLGNYTNNEWQILRRIMRKGWLAAPETGAKYRSLHLIGFEPFIAEAVEKFRQSVAKDLELTDAPSRSRPTAE